MTGMVKGPAIFLAQFAGDAAPFNSFDAICRWAAVARLQGRADPDLGRAAHRSGQSRGVEDLLRRADGIAREPRPGDHRTVDASAGPARRGQPGLRRSLRRLRAEGDARAPARAPEMGGRAVADGGQGLAPSRPQGARDGFSGALAWPFVYPWPQRAAGPDRDGVRGTGAALEADPRRLRRGRRRCRL